MEIRTTIWMRMLKRCFAVGLFTLLAQVYANAQVYTVKNGKMYIQVAKNISMPALDSFIAKYDLGDLALKYFLKTNIDDSLKLRGWAVENNNDESFAINKPLISSEDLTDLAAKIIFTGKPDFPTLFPSINNGILFGSNRFRNKSSFAVNDSTVTFYLRGSTKSKKVMLAGSFNDWSMDGLPMIKTDSGWIANVKLRPGKYWYKFIIDGSWTIDTDNQQRENDGMGNMNSVFYKTNFVFRLNGYQDARTVYVAGRFNQWEPRDKNLLMTKTGTGWELPVYLAEGTYIYKFLVNNDWIMDPANNDKYPNEFGEYNSVVRLGKAYLFKLKGYENARKVLVTGSFNEWRKDELFMQKTDSGWILPYTLGGGNYEYRFIVDGKEIIDPANPVLSSSDKKTQNSYLILEPNYTFRLKGYPAAKKVFLSGDFNNFSPEAFPMKRVGDEWVFSVHLTIGKHLYKFVVDNNWIRDPANSLWEQNEYKTGDSVIWFGAE